MIALRWIDRFSTGALAAAALVLLAPRLACADVPASDAVSQAPVTPFSTVRDSPGETALGEITGENPVYLKFWASWCRTCMAEMPHLREVHQQLGDNINIISVNIGINETNESIGRTIAEHNLTMPTIVDNRGALKRLFNFQGTPYHVVLDRNLQPVYAGYSASSELDGLLKDLARGNRQAGAQPPEISANTDRGALPEWFHADKVTAVLYTAEWCEWYLKETRPEMSKTCTDVQAHFSELAQRHPELRWRVVLSPLWTGDEEARKYRNRHAVKVPLERDTDSRLFDGLSLAQFPSVVILRSGEILATYEGAEFLDQAAEDLLPAAQR